MINALMHVLVVCVCVTTLWCTFSAGDIYVIISVFLWLCSNDGVGEDQSFYSIL